MNKELIRLLDLQLDQLKKEKLYNEQMIKLETGSCQKDTFSPDRMGSIRRARIACIDELIGHIDAILNNETVKGLFQNVGLFGDDNDEISK